MRAIKEWCAGVLALLILIAFSAAMGVASFGPALLAGRQNDQRFLLLYIPMALIGGQRFVRQSGVSLLQDFHEWKKRNE